MIDTHLHLGTKKKEVSLVFPLFFIYSTSFFVFFGAEFKGFFWGLRTGFFVLIGLFLFRVLPDRNWELIEFLYLGLIRVFDSRAQQEMSCLSSDWSCGLDNFCLSQI